MPTAQELERWYGERHETLQLILGHSRLQRRYRPAVNTRSAIFDLARAIWRYEIEDRYDDEEDGFDSLPEEIVNAVLTYCSMDIAIHGPVYVRPLSYRACGCGDVVSTASSSDEWCDDCERCRSCCDCARCSECSSIMGDTECSCCNRCEHCCNCRTCEECGEVVLNSNFCSDCDRCDDCGCRCGASSLNTRREGRPRKATQHHELTKLKSSRLLGIEWELNSVEDAEPIHTWAQQWSGGIHEDGSCGWELVTPPLSGNYVVDCIDALSEAWDEANTKADDRCGLHVHVDARDFMWSDMYRLLGIYAHLEPVLFAIAGQNRQRNQYCAPCGHLFKEALASMDRKGSVLSLLHKRDRGDELGSDSARLRFKESKGSVSKKSDGRYRSLNLEPWLARHREGKERVKDCTVEFRLHRNTTDGHRVREWAILCVRIMDWVYKASDADAARVVQKSALHALAEIAPESMEWVLERLRDWRRATSFKKRTRRTVQVRGGHWTCVA